jgi:hypothetical protein
MRRYSADIALDEALRIINRALGPDAAESDSGARLRAGIARGLLLARAAEADDEGNAIAAQYYRYQANQLLLEK